MVKPHRATTLPNSQKGKLVMKKIAVILAALLLAACSTTQKTDTSQTPPASAATESTAPATAPVSAAQAAENQLAAEAQDLQKQSVYFDFDKFAVKHEYRSDLQKQADFIKEHKNDIVTLEGNCDERGSEKYNQVLGSKRAKAVRHKLLLLGVAAAQIKTVSFGKDRPRLLCHEEKCWKENRRVDFVHKLD
jgi:peptidoglycan-associated lipoprotein